MDENLPYLDDAVRFRIGEYLMKYEENEFEMKQN